MPSHRVSKAHLVELLVALDVEVVQTLTRNCLFTHAGTASGGLPESSPSGRGHPIV
jgi:hypothetical protein